MPSEEYIDSALIWFKQSDNGFVNWTNKLQTFLERKCKYLLMQWKNKNIRAAFFKRS